MNQSPAPGKTSRVACALGWTRRRSESKMLLGETLNKNFEATATHKVDVVDPEVRWYVVSLTMSWGFLSGVGSTLAQAAW